MYTYFCSARTERGAKVLSWLEGEAGVSSLLSFVLMLWPWWVSVSFFLRGGGCLSLELELLNFCSLLSLSSLSFFL
jgi:hypothetical protein